MRRIELIGVVVEIGGRARAAVTRAVTLVFRMGGIALICVIVQRRLRRGGSSFRHTERDCCCVNNPVGMQFFYTGLSLRLLVRKRIYALYSRVVV